MIWNYLEWLRLFDMMGKYWEGLVVQKATGKGLGSVLFLCFVHSLQVFFGIFWNVVHAFPRVDGKLPNRLSYATLLPTKRPSYSRSHESSIFEPFMGFKYPAIYEALLVGDVGSFWSIIVSICFPWLSFDPRNWFDPRKCHDPVVNESPPKKNRLMNPSFEALQVWSFWFPPTITSQFPNLSAFHNRDSGQRLIA